MANATNIEWTDFNWNFLRGCSRVSEGCRNCYAEDVAARFSGEGQPYHKIAKCREFVGDLRSKWTGEISFHEDILVKPLRWQKPRRVFVNSMSDLFHEKVEDEWLDKAFAVMALTPQHTYQILTKRPTRMREYVSTKLNDPGYFGPTQHEAIHAFTRSDKESYLLAANCRAWPLPNVHLGVSVEDQKTADERIPILLETPAAVRWISAEPLLALIFLRHFLPHGGWGGPALDWVVVGGESGPRARPCDVQWIRSVVEQCKAASVPVFVKQLGAKPIWPCEPECADPVELLKAIDFGIPHDAAVCACRCHERLLDHKGGDPAEWPEEVRIREFP